MYKYGIYGDLMLDSVSDGSGTTGSMGDLASGGGAAGAGITDPKPAEPTGGESLNAQSEREKQLEKQLAEASKKSEILDQMLDDDRFQSWLNNETDDGPTGDKSGGTPTPVTPQVPDGNTGLNGAMSELQEKNPELAGTIGKLFGEFERHIGTQLSPRIKNMEDGIQKANFATEVQKSVTEINAMKADTENYPLFEQVWTDMAKILQGQRAGSMADAYTLAVAETVPLNRIAMKSRANMVQGSQGSVNKNIANKLYKNPREAAEAALSEMGWTPEGDF